MIYYFFYFIQVNIEPQNDMKDAEMPEQMEPVISSNDSDTFCDETKPFYGGDNNGISEFDDALVGETMDNDSDPSFKDGSDHAGSSEYLFLNVWMFSSISNKHIHHIN